MQANAYLVCRELAIASRCSPHRGRTLQQPAARPSPCEHSPAAYVTLRLSGASIPSISSQESKVVVQKEFRGMWVNQMKSLCDWRIPATQTSLLRVISLLAYLAINF